MIAVFPPEPGIFGRSQSKHNHFSFCFRNTFGNEGGWYNPPVMISRHKALPTNRFEADTMRAVSAARAAFASIIELKCPGSNAVSSIAAAFKIHRKLAWQLIKATYSDDPFVAARHMPTPKGIEVWTKSMRDLGMPTELIAAIKAADARFQDLVQTHAADRAEFDMLVESTRSGADRHDEERRRQQSFEGNSFTWGARCKVQLALCVLMPSEDRPGFFHVVQVKGLMGFRQTRPGLRWVVNQSVAVDDNVQEEAAMQRVPIDPAAAAAHNGVPVIPAFCSQPMPKLERTVAAGGMMQDELAPTEVGLSGERTLVTGEVLRNIAPAHATENDKVAHFGTAVRTPAEMLHFDLFVHAALFGNVARELRVFSDMASPIAFSDADALKVSDTISRLGRGLDMAQAPDLVGYRSLAASIFERLETSPADYELYRVRMAYPPMPTTVMFKHDLPPRAG